MLRFERKLLNLSSNVCNVTSYENWNVLACKVEDRFSTIENPLSGVEAISMQALWNNPIFYKYRLLEKREYRKSKSNFWVKQMLLVWCVLVPLAWVVMMTLPEVLDALTPKYKPEQLYVALNHLSSNWLGALGYSHLIVLMVAIGIAINGTTSLVTGEREKKTFESLQSTMMSPTEIVNGRVLAGLWPVLRELTIVSPLALLLGLISGFAFKALLCVCLLYSTVLFYGMVGLWSSYFSKSTQNANRLATGIAASLVVGIPVVASLTSNWELMRLHPVYASCLLDEGFAPVILVTAFHFCGAALLWLDALRRERSAVRI